MARTQVEPTSASLGNGHRAPRSLAVDAVLIGIALVLLGVPLAFLAVPTDAVVGAVRGYVRSAERRVATPHELVTARAP